MKSLVNCNKCQEKFIIEKVFRRYFMMGREKITEIYFRCTHCKNKYISAYENKQTLDIQKKINKGKCDPKLKKIPFVILQQKVKKFLEEKDKSNQEIK